MSHPFPSARPLLGAVAGAQALLAIFLYASALAAAQTSSPGDRPASASAAPGDSACSAAAPAIYVPPSALVAEQNGTRARSGAPGPRYWQQRTDYRIEVAVEPSSRRLEGRETIRYTNNSPDTLEMLVMRLYQNLFREGVRRVDVVPVTGGLTLDSLVVEGRSLEVSDADSSQTVVDGTLFAARLEEPMLPGEAREIRAVWSFTIPPTAEERMGAVDSTSFFLAQWYPQIAVYDDLNGWATGQYLGPGEFYNEYGDFEVSVTVPAGFGVWATGTLENPRETWSDKVRERAARAASSEKVVHVITQSDLGPGKATRGAAGERLTWRFTADEVRDFAFAVGDHYLWDMTGARVTPGGERSVAASAVYRPGAPGFEDVAEFARVSLETFSLSYPAIPYPYPQMTVVEGGSGGMEYPMIVLDAATPDRNQTLEVTAHEIGHTWYPMLVGSNETVYGWQDEGVNTFITLWAQEAMGFEPAPREQLVATYASLAGHELEVPLMTPANMFTLEGPWYFLAAYAKPAVTLLTLRGALTPEVFDAALREYTRRWINKHPSPWDFFNTFEDVAKQDLDWFWDPWFFGRGVLDQALAGVEPADGRVKVTVENLGRLAAPAEVAVENDKGEVVRARIAAAAWACGSRHVLEVPVSGEAASVTLNPDFAYPDVDPGDNRWPPGEQGN